MQHIIAKFGGTSVSSRETWDNILSIAKQHIQHHAKPVIVCSAITNISNMLDSAVDAALVGEHQHLHQAIVEKHQQLADALDVPLSLIDNELTHLEQWLTGVALLKTAPPKTRAQVMSLGELMLTRLGHAFLNQQGVSCQWLDARSVLKSTPMPGGEAVNYLTARCDPAFNAELKAQLSQSNAHIILTQGFIASNAEHETVLLGRGGSDTSAAILAAAIGASQCEIWTDVAGIYTANPHQIPQARLLKQLDYDEAQEIASMGAKVLHPNCIPPVKHAGIPMFVKYTRMPSHSGTRISKDSDESAPPIKSIQAKHSITLISIDTLNMWQQVGFLADVFAVFKQHEFSVDLLSSSEFNVTLSLDSNGKRIDRYSLEALIDDLNHFGRARIIEPCSAVSLVGRHIRTVLPELGPTLEVFEAKQIYMMSLASNDLNLTYVVDESQAEKLCQKLHHLLIENNPQSFYYSKSWHEEFGEPMARKEPWWRQKREVLLKLANTHSPCYVYDEQTLTQRADDLLAIEPIDRLFYAMKANSCDGVLDTFYKKGLGFECVSIHELQHITQRFPDINPSRLLFTPNFAPKSEYEAALATGCYLTIDNLYPLMAWPELFKNKEVILRIDPGTGAGHHKFVSTAGNESKFGIPKHDIAQTVEWVKRHHIHVIGLHSHSGSGILTTDLWKNTAKMLSDLVEQFPDVRFINLGGGLGIAEKPGQQNLDLGHLETSLQAVKAHLNGLEFWLEPGRYLVAESGVILAKVTQCKSKGKVNFIGIETGMNSLIRPALYGAYHEIVNLTHLNEPRHGFAHVVGPICESSDTLGYDRPFPVTQEGDVLLIANTGAYGHCMASDYNMRPPAKEWMLNEE